MTAVHEELIVGLPGLTLPGLPAAPRPDRLLVTGTGLLAGVTPGVRQSLVDHRRHWPQTPRLQQSQLAAIAEGVGLRGHGGAGFPTAIKVRSMVGRAGPVVVNGSEGEQASAKDSVLLTHVPHLVLDGAEAAANALGSGKVIVRLTVGRTETIRAVRAAIGERPRSGPRIVISLGPDEFVAGEATAIVRALSGGPALPDDLGKPPRMRQPLRSPRPVLLSNVETFARLAAAVAEVPADTVLLTVSGAVRTPGVMEVSATSTVAEAVDCAGGMVGRPQALVTGGWHGSWLPMDTRTLFARVSREGLAAVDGRLGAGVIMVLPGGVCPVDVASAVARELAAASAGQCGPCVRGLPALAAAISGAAPAAHVESLVGDVSGRGLCAHPTATAAALQSAVRLLGAELDRHRAGFCSASGGSPR